MKNIFITTSAATTFGIIDNGIMILAGDQIDTILSCYFDAMTSAGIGNAISDMLGVLASGIVLTMLQKIFKAKIAPSTFQEFIAIGIGCMIPVIIWAGFQLI